MHRSLECMHEKQLNVIKKNFIIGKRRKRLNARWFSVRNLLLICGWSNFMTLSKRIQTFDNEGLVNAYLVE